MVLRTFSERTCHLNGFRNMFNLTLCFNFDFSSAWPILGHASPTRQFLNGTHKLSGTGSGQNGPARGSVLSLRSQKRAGISRVMAEKCTRVPWTFLFKFARTSFFRSGRTGQWEATLEHGLICVDLHPIYRIVWCLT